MAAAELAWDQLAAHPATAAAARRMTVHIEATPARAAARLGRSAWNAYSFNVDYRTGALRPHAHTLERLLPVEIKTLIPSTHVSSTATWEGSTCDLSHRSLLCSTLPVRNIFISLAWRL